MAVLLFQGSIDGGTSMLSWEFLPLPLTVPFIRLHPFRFFISPQIILNPLSYAFYDPPDPPLVFIPDISTQYTLASSPLMAVEVTLKNGEIVTVNGHSSQSNLFLYIYERF